MNRSVACPPLVAEVSKNAFVAVFAKLIQRWKKMCRLGEMTNGYTVLVGKPDRKRLLGRRR
jgi:hypothetical protein